MGTQTNYKPRIYVSCLAAYNNGILHGAWIVADQGTDTIRAEISAMLKASPIAGAEEYVVSAYEDFGEICIDEYAGVNEVAELAAFVAEHGQLGATLYSRFFDLGEAREALEDRYCGVFKSIADFMEESVTETTEIPDQFLYYIDWERMARDAELSGDIFTINTAHDEIHVFWAR